MLLGNRYYDCSTGRFISQDPAQDESNWYAHCGNNPLVAVGPSGPEAVGHHFIPQAVYKDVGVGWETLEIFENTTTGPLASSLGVQAA